MSLAAICATTLLAAALAGAAATAALGAAGARPAWQAEATTPDRGEEQEPPEGDAAETSPAEEGVARTGAPSEADASELPDASRATEPVVPKKAKAGSSVELGGTEWSFEVAATYDEEELASAGRRISPTLSKLPEKSRSIRVLGFRADGERWAYAVAAGDGDSVRLVVSASSVLRIAPGVVEAEAGTWQSIVDASAAKGTER